MIVDCKTCISGNNEWCCEGCDFPKKEVWNGSCLHYQKTELNSSKEVGK